MVPCLSELFMCFLLHGCLSLLHRCHGTRCPNEYSLHCCLAVLLYCQVINLSIAAYVSPDSDDAEDTLRIVCQIFQEASDAGAASAQGRGGAGHPNMSHQ